MKTTRLVFSMVVALLPVLFAACSGEEPEEAQTANRQPAEVRVTFRVQAPESTPDGSKIFIAGNLIPRAAWLPDGLPLEPGEQPNEWFAEVRLPRAMRLEYKVTRGSWPTVEKHSDGREMQNRVLEPDKDTSVDVVVETWADLSNDGTPTESTITGDVRRHESVASQYLDRLRDVLVYLPPGYEVATNRRYPVLYMHDAQNVFDAATSFTGVEWHADEHADQLIREEVIEPLIIVAIENTDARMDEYTPSDSKAMGVGGKGDDYVRFIVEELRPFINETYRTKTAAKDTGIAGSSLGGLISLYAAYRHPDIFGKCAAISPSLWWNGRRLLNQIEEADASWAENLRLWVDMGSLETVPFQRIDKPAEDVERLAEFMKNAGRIEGRDLRVEYVEGGRHSEASWADRFDDVLMFLFPVETKDREGDSGSDG